MKTQYYIIFTDRNLNTFYNEPVDDLRDLIPQIGYQRELGSTDIKVVTERVYSETRRYQDFEELKGA